MRSCSPPTHEHVAVLNQAAREHRLAGSRPRSEADLADGNRASIGDTIVTRRNDRRLRAGSGWVKNGDRWQVHDVHRDGALDVHDPKTHRRITLPADYVTTHVELGYATTIHGAQGTTADTCHGLLTGQESRQQLYTMLSRGRHANHAYLQTTGEGDPHNQLVRRSMSNRWTADFCAAATTAGGSWVRKTIGSSPPPPAAPRC